MAAAEGTQLTDLPLWFHERHENDRYRDEEKKDVKKHEHPGRPTPAVVVFSWKSSADREPLIFGSLDDLCSMCRARPSFMTQYVTFDIDVREGQSYGMDDADARVKDRPHPSNRHGRFMTSSSTKFVGCLSMTSPQLTGTTRTMPTTPRSTLGTLAMSTPHSRTCRGYVPSIALIGLHTQQTKG